MKLKLTLASFELAKKLKDIGFDEETSYYYDQEFKGKKPMTFMGNIDIDGYKHPSYTKMPTLELAKMWLREEYIIEILIDRQLEFWGYRVRKFHSLSEIGGVSDTYETALEKGLLEACKLINNKPYVTPK